MSDDFDLFSEKERYFRAFQIWPLSKHFDTQQFRTNFEPEEQVFVNRLLDRFIYFSDALVDALVVGAVQRLLNDSYRRTENPHCSRIPGGYGFVNVEGEQSHPADSGYSFSRRARDVLGIPEADILTPDDALEKSNAYHTFVFLDDFVGSGNQMVATWERHRCLPDGSTSSFAELAKSGSHRVAYCPCLCTAEGRENLEKYAQELHLVPAHLLSARHNATKPNSFMWEGVNEKEAFYFLEQAGSRAGFTANDGSEDDWRGFNKLGLSVAFHGSIPDASLPIFYSERNGWKPLMRRS